MDSNTVIIDSETQSELMTVTPESKIEKTLKATRPVKKNSEKNGKVEKSVTKPKRLFDKEIVVDINVTK